MGTNAERDENNIRRISDLINETVVLEKDVYHSFEAEPLTEETVDQTPSFEECFTVNG